MYIFIYYYSTITPDLRKTDTQLRVATLSNLFHIPSEEGYTLYEKSRRLFTVQQSTQEVTKGVTLSSG